jgi:ferredoxin-NADP reductase
LIAGGSGIVPLMAMLRLARRTGTAHLVRLLVSVRTPDDLYFAGELPGPEVAIAYTRVAPAGSARGVGRLALPDVAPLVRGGETVFVCGSAGFADAVTDLLVAAGVPTAAIRVERFGPSG